MFFVCLKKKACFIPILVNRVGLTANMDQLRSQRGPLERAAREGRQRGPPGQQRTDKRPADKPPRQMDQTCSGFWQVLVNTQPPLLWNKCEAREGRQKCEAREVRQRGPPGQRSGKVGAYKMIVLRPQRFRIGRFNSRNWISKQIYIFFMKKYISPIML